MTQPTDHSPPRPTVAAPEPPATPAQQSRYWFHTPPRPDFVRRNPQGDPGPTGLSADASARLAAARQSALEVRAPGPAICCRIDAW